MLWIGASARQPAPAQGRPNIVFVLADDLGVNDLGVYGRKEHRTPSLDRLAAEGPRFTTAYVASPICSPSRAAIMTGRFPARLHLTTFIPGRPDAASQKLLHPPMRQQLPLEEKTLAEHLRGAGYATAMIGKWHLGEAGFSPREQGFDVFHAGQATTAPSDVEGGKGEYDLTREAERFIDANRDRPFFLYLAHNNPHIPFRSARPELIASNRSAFEPAYAATVQTLDDSVGRLLAHLDKTGLRDRTIVIFTSDNGGLHVPEGPHPRVTHNTPYRAGKGYLFEGGLRVPLIVRGPGLAARRVVDAPFVNVDWLPTLLELSGTDVPREIDGPARRRSCAPGKPRVRRELCTGTCRTTPIRAAGRREPCATGSGSSSSTTTTISSSCSTSPTTSARLAISPPPNPLERRHSARSSGPGARPSMPRKIGRTPLSTRTCTTSCT